MTIAVTPVGQSVVSFAYQAQTQAGQPMSGTIDAVGLDEANQKLQSLGLRIISIEPMHAPARQRPLSDGDFLAFNEQLAQLTGAGLPVEQGLKLIAKDLHRGRLRTAVAGISEELERGVPLAEAMSKHRGQFPPLYGRIIEAGIRSNNLSALLLNLGTHLETVRRLRASLWRATAYPIMVLFALMVVLFFLSQAVIPQFQAMYDGFRNEHSAQYGYYISRWGQKLPDIPRPALPVTTQLVFAAGKAMPVVFCASILLLIVFSILFRSGSGQNRMVESVSLRIPLIGPILRASLLARWCDAAHLGIVAGVDLPGAIRLASDAVGSPGLILDGSDLAHDLEGGRPFAMDVRRVILPATVPTAIELAARSQNLPAALQSLADLYRRQADSRLENLPTILTPLLLAFLAVVMGFVIAGLVVPMLQLIQWVTGGLH